MKNVIVFSLCFAICGSCSSEKSSQVTQESGEGWVSLIDIGLNHWDHRGTLDAGVVEDILTLTAGEDQTEMLATTSMLVTKENYDNFHLKFEVQSSNIQSSFFFRFNDKLSTVPERSGYTLSIDANLDQLNPSGTIISIARSTVPEKFDATQWNSMELTVIGTRLTVFINGQKVAEANDKKFPTGKLGIQVPSQAGETVRFRNMQIQPLVTIAVVTELLEDRYRADDRSWETLFDGKSLSGWDPIGDGSWKVEDGAIHGYSGVNGGFLVSKNAYKNFYLTTQFKIIKEDNSGIFIRKSPDSAAVTITDAIECNIYDHNGPAHAYSTGSIATHARAWYGMIDYEDWNSMEIFTEEDHIVMYINGRKSSESYVPSKFNKVGNICLQGGIKVFSEDKGPSDIYFKDIMIKSMD